MTAETPSSWTFLTNHCHVLLAISNNPEIRQREIADVVGITIGAVQRIIHELEDEGFVTHEKVGRRNLYRLNSRKSLRHPLVNEHSIDELVTSLK